VSAGLPLSRLPDEQPRLDGSIHIDGPHDCFVCGASSAEVEIDPVFDSAVPGYLKYACNDLLGCLERARKIASESI
jgi:hypothetical protein